MGKIWLKNSNSKDRMSVFTINNNFKDTYLKYKNIEQVSYV